MSAPLCICASIPRLEIRTSVIVLMHHREVKMPTKRSEAATSEQSSSLPLRERQRNALRADIQQAALRMFAAQGYDNVTTEAIAEEVGISPSTWPLEAGWRAGAASTTSASSSLISPSSPRPGCLISTSSAPTGS